MIFLGIETIFSGFNVFITTQNYLSQLSLTKNSKTFTVESGNQYKGTV